MENAEKTQSNQQNLTDKNCPNSISIVNSKFRVRTRLPRSTANSSAFEILVRQWLDRVNLCIDYRKILSMCDRERQLAKAQTSIDDRDLQQALKY
ncbi:hypothetical protein [Chamaesiphon minutus]|uniref:hypothetical protein n=1 Tax=Chamaesiphon minutus TaxID=1173032 RepID=UPI0002DCC153|nr:hypothetical protein [Chamaesiphon minutus]